MTNSVYGFIESRCIPDFEVFFNSLEKEKGLGIKPMEKNLLYGFPVEILNRFNNNCSTFIIADNPTKNYIAYLTSPYDFAPDAEIGLPVELNDRLMLLADFFKHMIDKAKASQLVFAMVDLSCVIEESKIIKLEQLKDELIKDFSLCNNQPNCLYDLKLD